MLRRLVSLLVNSKKLSCSEKLRAARKLAVTNFSREVFEAMETVIFAGVEAC